MILSDIRKYLRQKQQASLTELSKHFAVEPEALRGMLDHLILKGHVSISNQTTQTQTAACGKNGGCQGCSTTSLLCAPPSESEIFRWSRQ